jgi:hypothetical protein
MRVVRYAGRKMKVVESLTFPRSVQNTASFTGKVATKVVQSNPHAHQELQVQVPEEKGGPESQRRVYLQRGGDKKGRRVRNTSSMTPTPEDYKKELIAEFDEKFMDEYFRFVGLGVGYPRSKQEFFDALKAYISSALDRLEERTVRDIREKVEGKMCLWKHKDCQKEGYMSGLHFGMNDAYEEVLSLLSLAREEIQKCISLPTRDEAGKQTP